MDFIREWKSKALDSEQVFRRFARCISQQKISFARKLILSTNSAIRSVSQFYRPNVEKRYSTQDQSLIASPFGKIYLTSHTVVASSALDQS